MPAIGVAAQHPGKSTHALSKEDLSRVKKDPAMCGAQIPYPKSSSNPKISLVKKK
jgi:hypothetical protein